MRAGQIVSRYAASRLPAGWIPCTLPIHTLRGPAASHCWIVRLRDWEDQPLLGRPKVVNAYWPGLSWEWEPDVEPGPSPSVPLASADPLGKRGDTPKFSSSMPPPSWNCTGQARPSFYAPGPNGTTFALSLASNSTWERFRAVPPPKNVRPRRTRQCAPSCRRTEAGRADKDHSYLPSLIISCDLVRRLIKIPKRPARQ